MSNKLQVRKLFSIATACQVSSRGYLLYGSEVIMNVVLVSVIVAVIVAGFMVAIMILLDKYREKYFIFGKVRAACTMAVLIISPLSTVFTMVAFRHHAEVREVYATYEVIDLENNDYISTNNDCPSICYVEGGRVRTFALNDENVYFFVDSEEEVRVDSCKVGWLFMTQKLPVAYILK